MDIRKQSLKKHYEWNGKIEVIARAPLVVLAVFVYCIVATPPAPAEATSDSEEAAIEMMESEATEE